MTETWVEILVPPLSKGDPGPLEMVTVHETFFGVRTRTPYLVRQTCWRHGRKTFRWWKRLR